MKWLYLFILIIFSILEGSRVFEFYRLVGGTFYFSLLLTLAIIVCIAISGAYHKSIIARLFIFSMIVASFMVSLNEMNKQSFYTGVKKPYRYSCNHPSASSNNCIQLKECESTDFTNLWKGSKWVNVKELNRCKANYDMRYKEINSLAQSTERENESRVKFKWLEFIGMLFASLISSIFFPVGIVIATNLLKRELDKAPKVVVSVNPPKEENKEKEILRLLEKTKLSYSEIAEKTQSTKTKVYRLNEKHKIRKAKKKIQSTDRSEIKEEEKGIQLPIRRVK